MPHIPKQPSDGQAESQEMRDAQAELESATRRVADLGAEQANLDLARVGGKLDAEQVKAEMEAVKRRVERATRDVQRASDRVKRELDRQMREMRGDLARKMATVNAALAPVKKRIALMQEGIETIGLYLSAAQGVVTIRDGERAHDQEPIVIRQMVLSMDEETGLFAEGDGLTADDIDAFDAWLLADPARVEQVIPDRKGVVALVARFSEREHGNPWSHDPSDHVTHFLIRNGDALFRTTVGDFMAGRVLVPTADEFAQFFFRRDFDRTRRPLEPGTREYADAMERSDKRSRHFLRIGLILQGLVDNSEVFAPLHPAGVNMLSDPSERSEKVRIITDAEGGLESGQATFREWQAQVNEGLRPGMRIIGAFDGGPWRDANDWDRESRLRGHSRCHPAGWNWEAPPSGVPLLIEDRRPDGGLVVRYQRERAEIFDTSINEPVPGKPGYVYRGKHRKPKLRASATLYAYDSFILAYDLIESSDQLRGFLASRRNRAGYRELWPLIKSAMFAKAAEEAAEAPFRTMLAGVLARENHVTVADAEAEVGELIRWFKLKNRWARPLTLETMTGLEAAEATSADAALDERSRGGRLTSRAIGARLARVGWAADAEYDEAAYEAAIVAREAAALKGREHEALAVRMIVAEHARRLSDRRRPVNTTLVAGLRAEHPDAVLIARPRKGGYLVLLPAHPTENVWVHELDYTAAGELRDRADWRLPGADRVSRWTIAHSTDRWEAWDLHASDRDHLRGAREITQLAERILTLTVRHRSTSDALDSRPMMVSYAPPTPQRPGRFTLWTMTSGEDADEGGPTYQAIDRFHERRGGELRLHGSQSWYVDDTHRWVLGPEAKLPWQDSSYAARHVGRVVWGPDEQACARWIELRASHLRREAAERYVSKRARELGRRIVAQWEAVKTVELHAAFLADVPDADWHEWTEHLDASAPQWTWHDSHHHPHGDLGAVLRFLVSAGTDPTGWTAQQALDAARERGLPETWTGFRSSTHTIPERWPDEWADLVIGDEPVEIPTESQPDAADEPDDAARTDQGFEVLGPEEPEPERDAFDELRDAFKGLG